MSLENVILILTGTKHPGNIGSVARAMANMGMSRLVLAEPRCSINDESYRMAKSGGFILESAKTFTSMKAALRGIRFLVGTTGKSGGYRQDADTPRVLAPEIIDRAAGQKIGILFGPEDTGLIDEDLQRCQFLMRIPTHSKASSLNLAQAVIIISYELMLCARPHPPRARKLAPLEQSEAMYSQLQEALLDIGFLHAQNARHMMFALRRMLGRAGLESSDVKVLRGIARQIAWYAERNK